MDPRFPQVTGSRLAANGYEAAIALTAVILCFVFALGPATPSATTLGLLPAWLRWTWVLTYGVGGAMILYGLARGRVAGEIAGLLVFTGGILVHLVAYIAFLSLSRFTSAGPLLIGVAVSNLLRVRSLSRGQDVVALEPGSTEEDPITATAIAIAEVLHDEQYHHNRGGAKR